MTKLLYDYMTIRLYHYWTTCLYDSSGYKDYMTI